MAQYERDRTVQAGVTDARALGRLVLAAFDAVPDYEAVGLAPVEPVGLNSVLAGIDQNNVLATARATEVVADPTVALALQAAWRRRGGVDVVRMCAEHRVLRQQAFDPPALQHFSIFALVTGMRSQSDHRSDVEAMGEHVHAHLAVIAAARELGAAAEHAVVRISDTAVHRAATNAGVAMAADVSSLREAIPPGSARRLGRRLRRLEAATEALTPIVDGFGGRLLIDLTRTDGAAYYDGLQLRIDTTWKGAEREVADGGARRLGGAPSLRQARAPLHQRDRARAPAPMKLTDVDLPLAASPTTWHPQRMSIVRSRRADHRADTYAADRVSRPTTAGARPGTARSPAGSCRPCA